MQVLNAMPLVKLSLALVLGILCPWDQVAMLAYLSLLPLGLFLSVPRLRARPYQQSLISCCILLCTLGLGKHLHNLSRPQADRLDAFAHCKVSMISISKDAGKANPWGRKFNSTLVAIKAEDQDRFFSVSEKIILSLKTKHSLSIGAFDTLYSQAWLAPLRSKSASYLSYLHHQGIFYTAYFHQGQVGGQQLSPQAFSYKLQQSLAFRLESLIEEKHLLGIAQAMLLGEKRHLDKETRRLFATSGLSHVLAISGLHVGIIYLMLNFCLNFLQGLPHGKTLKVLLIMLLLLLFLGISGASPAVFRAVLMGEIMLLLKLFRRRFQLLNIVALACIIQLLVDPMLAFHPGFQLSYAAVSGILLLMPIFEKPFSEHASWVKQLWNCIGVSLCATAFTFPLVWHYFQSIAVYFLPANLLATLLVFLVVLSGFACLVASFIPGVDLIAAFIFTQLLQLLYLLCAWISNWPHATAQRLSISEMGFCLFLLQWILVLWVYLFQIHKQRITKAMVFMLSFFVNLGRSRSVEG